jgi:hypothetical protein
VAVEDYKNLIQEFLDGKHSADVFQTKYEDLYDPDFTEMPDKALDIIDELYVDVEAFSETPLTMDIEKFRVDEAELKKCVMRAKMKLNEMQ